MSLLNTETVAQLTQEIWAALLAADGLPELVPGELPGKEVLAMAEISGEWNGTVCLSCSKTAARHATRTMFGLEDEELTQADITDAVGELVNVVGGNIKSLVPGPSVLSLPRVSEGDEGQSLLLGHLELAQEVRFSWMAEPVVVSVWTAPNSD
jgi:chemotaxis protein CheX